MIEGLRWIEVQGFAAHNGIVRGLIPGFSSFMDRHFKLQFLDLSGRWCDVEIDPPHANPEGEPTESSEIAKNIGRIT